MRTPLLPLVVATLAACLGACGPVGAGDDDDDDLVPGDDFESCIPDFDDGPVFKETLTLGDGASRLVRIVRRPGDGPTIGETFAFDLLGFALQDGDALSACVTDEAALDYVYEHHNWDDQAIATVADEGGAHAFTLAMVYDVVNGTWTDTLDDSRNDEGPVPLVVQECVSEGPSPANGCFARNP